MTIRVREGAMVNTLGLVFVLIITGIVVFRWSKSPNWTPLHEFAVASGCIGTYIWYCFVQVPPESDISPIVDAIGNAAFSLGILIVIYFGWRRLTETESYSKIGEHS